MPTTELLSVVVPAYNESAGLRAFDSALVTSLKKLPLNYEVIYVDDGSTDTTAKVASTICAKSPHTKLISLSRNFGKEAALYAGIKAARGDAILTLDGDGQHPVELIPKFVASWHKGSQVVIGVRKHSAAENRFKRTTSRLFYKIFNSVNEVQLVPGSTDFRLIDQAVREAFLQLKESERMTRGIIDWLGFERSYIPFQAKKRTAGTPTYSLRKLSKLAIDSFVSLSPTPLYIFGWLGVIITVLSFIFGIVVFVEQILLDDPLRWNFTGTAMLGILIIFLVGIVLTSQGVVSLYISHIHKQGKQRPLYVINYRNSRGIKKS